MIFANCGIALRAGYLCLAFTTREPRCEATPFRSGCAIARRLDRLEDPPQYYRKNVRQRMILEWRNKANGIVSIDERLDFEIVLYDSRKPASYVARSYVAAGKTMDEAKARQINFTLDGKPVAPLEIMENGAQKLTVKLAQKPSSQLTMIKHYTHNIRKRPVFFFFSWIYCLGNYHYSC
jgi:hypothetical protein